jgi:pentatricopeptide repeat protein
VVPDLRPVYFQKQMCDVMTRTLLLLLMRMISRVQAYGELGRPESSLALFDKLIEAGLVPDEVTFATAIHACGRCD